MEMRKIMSEQTVRKIRLKGHETFILREGWLAKGLKAVSDNPKVFSEYAGADALGVGTNMAKAIHMAIASPRPLFILSPFSFIAISAITPSKRNFILAASDYLKT